LNTDESKLPTEQLISMAGNSNYISDPHLWGRYTELAKVKIQSENIALTKRNREISEKQLDVSNEANALAKRLLISNEQASRENGTNAELMNSATSQLARSTSSLNRAIWLLIAFTAIQALIASQRFMFQCSLRNN
jgi:hypothetical protein